MELFGLQVARAGQFLREYEKKKYSVFDRIGLGIRSMITVPPVTEDFADLSFWQATMDWNKYKQFARAAIIRLGQGAWIDTEFEYNYKSAKENGIILGGYWFYDDRNSPAEQAQRIIELCKNKTFEMEIYVDWEHNYGGKYGGLKNAVALMKMLDAAHLNVKDIGMYTGYYWFTEHQVVGDKDYYGYLKTKPLWLAWYAAPNIVKVPAPWTTWMHWQKGTPTIGWGQPTSEIDMNVFNGTKEQFTARYYDNQEPIPQTTHLVELYIDKVLVHSQTI